MTRIFENLINISENFKLEFGEKIKIQEVKRDYVVHFDEDFVLRNPVLPNFLVREKAETDNMYFTRLNDRCNVKFSRFLINFFILEIECRENK